MESDESAGGREGPGSVDRVGLRDAELLELLLGDRMDRYGVEVPGADRREGGTDQPLLAAGIAAVIGASLLAGSRRRAA